MEDGDFDGDVLGPINDKSLGLEERLLHDEADGDSEGPEDSDVDGDVLGPINCKSLGLTVGLLLGEA
jgi:hypothetical protein